MADGAKELDMENEGTIMGIRRISARLLFASLILLASLAPACSGHSRLTSATPSVSTPPESVDYAQAAGEVLVARVPDGVAPQLWDELTAELASQLKSVSREPLPVGQEDSDSSIKVGATYYGLWWSGPALLGDGNLDGTVDIADLTEIALHYGETPEVTQASVDYNRDGVINVSDVSFLARNWGQVGNSYFVESTRSPNGPYALLAEVDYGDFDTTDNKANNYLLPFNGRGYDVLIYRLTCLKTDGLTVVSKSYIIGAIDPCQPANRPVTDLSVIDGIPIYVTWSTKGIIADGNQNGVSEIYDVELIANYFNERWDIPESRGGVPEAEVADYEFDGVVDAGDLNPLVMSWGCYITHFEVSVSTTSAIEGFSPVGEVDYLGDCAGIYESGFRYYFFEIPSPPAPPYWVTVTPYADDMPGVASTPLLVEAS